MHIPPSTSYGTWNNHGDEYNVTPEATVADAINGGDADWHERVVNTGSLDRMVSDYRDAINAALPPGVSLCGDLFYGPYRMQGCDFTGYPQTKHGELDIEAIVAGIDLAPIIERHDPDLAHSETGN